MATPLSMVFDILAIDRASAVFKRVGDAATLAGTQSESGMARVGGAMTRLAQGMALAGAAATVVSVKMAADFQQATNQLVTSAGESQQNLELVRKGLLNMAGQVGISAADLAKAMYAVESAGYHGARGLDVMKAAAQGAKAEGADAETVAKALTTVLNDYGKAVNGDPIKGTNFLIESVSLGKTRLQDFSSAISGVLSVAQPAGISLAEVGAAMSTMTAEGLNADVAATYLRQTIGRLSDTTPKARNEMKALGLDATDLSAHLGERGLAGTLQIMTDAIQRHLGPNGLVYLDSLRKAGQNADKFQVALTNLPAAAQSYIGALATMVGGQRTMMGALALTGEHMATFKTDIGLIQGAINDNATAVHGWDLVQTSFNQKLSELKASAGAIAIEFGTKLLPILTTIVGYLADHQQVLKDAAIGIAGLFAAAATYTVLVNPFTWIIVGLGAIATLAVTAYDNFKPFHDLVNGVAGTVGNAASTAFTATSGFVAGALGKTPPSQQLPAGTNRGLNAKLMTAGGDAPLAAPTAGTFAGRGFAADVARFVKNDFVPALKTAGDFIQTQVIPKIRSFWEAVQQAIKSLQQWGRDALDVWNRFGRPVADFIGKELTHAFHAVKDFIDTSFMPTWKALIDVFGPFVLPVLKVLGGAIAALAAILAVTLVLALDAVAVLLRDVVGPVMKILASIFIETGVVIGNVIIGILVVFKNFVDQMLSDMSTIFHVIGLVDPNFKAMGDTIDTWKHGFDDNMNGALASVHGFVDGADAKLKELWGSKHTLEIDARLSAGYIDSVNANSIMSQEKTPGFAGTTHATGGAIRGPGSGTSDSIPAWLSNGEHVWTAREVAAAGGHHAVEAMRRGVLGRFATGGPVLDMNLPDPGPWVSQIGAGIDAAVKPLLPQALAHLMAAAASSMGGGSAAIGSWSGQQGGLSPEAARAAAQAMLPAGWDMGALIKLWNQESGWRWSANNPSSGAYGIPQSLPASKMASAGADYMTNAITQIRWGLDYIGGRYGNPQNAWAHETAMNWYERGTGYVPVTGPAILHQGEAVIPANRNNSTGRGGGDGTATFHLYDTDGVLMGSIHGAIDQRDRQAYRDARARV